MTDIFYSLIWVVVKWAYTNVNKILKLYSVDYRTLLLKKKKRQKTKVAQWCPTL